MSNIHDKHQEGQETQETNTTIKWPSHPLSNSADESDNDDDAMNIFTRYQGATTVDATAIDASRAAPHGHITTHNRHYGRDNAWMVDEEPGMLPAIPRQTKAGEQPASSITQEKPRQKEQAGAQSYRSLRT